MLTDMLLFVIGCLENNISQSDSITTYNAADI